MKSLTARLQLGLGCLLLPALLIGAERRVASGAELARSLSAAKPGDTITLADGTYSDLVVELTCSGKQDAPITFRAATPGKVIFTRDARVHVKGSHVIVSGIRFDEVGPSTKHNVVHFEGAKNSRLTQCAFYRCGNDKWRHIVRLGGSSQHCRVDHNYFERIRGQGIGITRDGENTDNQVDHNWLNRTEGDGGENNGFEPIQLGAGGPSDFPMRAIIEYNLIENMRTEDDADPELISLKSGYNVVRYNTFRNNSPDRCLTLRNADHCLIEGNFLLGCYIRGYGTGHRIINNVVIGGKEGIHLPGGGTKMYAETKDCIIAHNTVIDPRDDGIELNGDGAPSGPALRHIQVVNNVVVGGRGNLYYQGEAAKDITYSGNLGFNTGSATVAHHAEVAFTADPQIDLKTGRLTTDASPAKDAGAPVLGVEQDIDQQPRDAHPDLGADEIVPGGNVHRPLTPADVGPSWLGGPAG